MIEHGSGVNQDLPGFDLGSASLPDIVQQGQTVLEGIQSKTPFLGVFDMYRQVAKALPKYIPHVKQQEAIEASRSRDRIEATLGTGALFFMNLHSVLTAVNGYLSGDLERDNDLIQETLVAFAAQAPRLNPNRMISSQVHGIIKNVAERFLDSETNPSENLPISFSTHHPQISGEGDVVDAASRALLRESVVKAVSGLSSKRGRYIIQQVFGKDRPQTELVKKMGVTHSRVGQILDQSLKSLRRNRLLIGPKMSWFDTTTDPDGRAICFDSPESQRSLNPENVINLDQFWLTNRFGLKRLRIKTVGGLFAAAIGIIQQEPSDPILANEWSVNIVLGSMRSLLTDYSMSMIYQDIQNLKMTPVADAIVENIFDALQKDDRNGRFLQLSREEQQAIGKLEEEKRKDYWHRDTHSREIIDIAGRAKKRNVLAAFTLIQKFFS